MIGPPERAWLAVFAGMPRTGTTSLFHVLGQHPGIFQPFRKEVGFFLFHHQRGPAWFHALYRQRRPGQLGIDVTPEYFFSPDAILRIRAHVPDARVVLGVREPLDFARSLHADWMRHRAAPLLPGRRHHARADGRLPQPGARAAIRPVTRRFRLAPLGTARPSELVAVLARVAQEQQATIQQQAASADMLRQALETQGRAIEELRAELARLRRLDHARVSTDPCAAR